MSYIEELRDVIRKLHGVESKHLESVPIEETFQGQTVWEGVVEVFQLIGHPKAFQVFAWSHSGGQRQSIQSEPFRLPGHRQKSPALLNAERLHLPPFHAR